MDAPDLTEIPDDWIKRLELDIANNPTAGNAWRKLQCADLKEFALLALWGYAGGAAAYLTQMHKRAEEANRRLKAAIRAHRTARTGTPKRCRPDTDQYRAAEAHEGALRVPWPIPTDGTSIVEDELKLVAKQTGLKQFAVQAVRQALVKAAGKRSLLGPKYFLMLLQAYAAEYGVKLGVKALVALGDCADPNHSKNGLDPGTLGRYLRRIRKSFQVRLRSAKGELDF